ncbi:bifunctional 2-polyprenyl-6-hydroxyphenol methylase/3-demethylubiquinol 3-O-methyltransferase UbiG [Sphingomonas japonica]|uniref:Ubiquinone biosynthesis O-methyltransferase n=1 Tax=Sphingomonas japonica TaxID=511662 RepID=A0ABX0TXI3_9SPHN|nr:bifunctional 2-polyprenyl-6-hydroxyphenol methylase/3-demethylubiquinol 3-O-methyltransferase UbiG [Sphingomonas japonica]NIJ23011.1 2-polyprenyl-6-hydroxyphenyl methylase/3-demethylubiquinone-9 3-methyltransferase [Sphingomonas japonica]
MPNASDPAAPLPAPTASSIVAREAEHFGAMAADWWDPKGSSAMLHRLNPVRLKFLREAIDDHWSGDAAAFAPLAGKRALDIGCGAGLLTEPLARLGAEVTGIDAAPENITVAAAHARAAGLTIDYRTGDLAAVAEANFDLVTALEVVEHVADPEAFVAAIAQVLAPGGMVILSTPNRTALSRVAMIGIAEGMGAIPRGTHDWQRFIAADEMVAMLARHGLVVVARRGIGWSPTSGFALTPDERLNYILAAVRG